MTDYSLWEVILNGDFPAPTRVIEGVVQPVAPTTAEQRLARKNKLKARDTLLMALPDKHQLKFNINKDAKILIEAIEKRFGGNKETKKVQKTLLKQQYENFTCLSFKSLDQIYDRLQKLISQTHTLIWRNKKDLEEQSLDDLFNNLKIYEAEVKSSSSASTSTQNIVFVSSSNTDSTNEPVSAAASVSAVSAKIHVSALPNVDTLSNAIIYSFFSSQSTSPQLENDDLKQIDADDLEEIDLKWKMAIYDWSFQAEKEPTNYALMAFTSLSSSSENENDESLPPSPIYDRYQSGDGYHAVPPPYTGTFMPPKHDLVFHDAPNVNQTAHTTFNVELSLAKPDTNLSHTQRPSAPIIEDWVSDSEDDSEAEILQNAPSFIQPIEQVKTPRSSVKTIETSIPTANPKTTIPKPKSNGNCKNKKACFVCKSLDHLIKDCDFYENKMAQTHVRNHAQRGNHQQYANMTLLNLQKHVVPTAILTQSKLVPITAARPVTAAVPKHHVTISRLAKSVVTKPHSPPRRHINRSLYPRASNFSSEVTAAKAPMVTAVKGVQGKWKWKPKCPILDHVSCNISASMTLKRFDYNDALGRSKSDKGVIDSGCSRHITGNMSYLSDFKELNGGYIAFGGNPKGGKISGKGKIRTGKLDFDDVYFVKELKFNLFSVSHMCDKKNNVCSFY
nr:ribonuclease H-like domain-containing protein [Tanacetum cinerariifolium]